MAKSVLLRGLTMQKWKIRRIRRAVWESTGAINPRWAEAADHSAFSRLVPIADYLGFKIIPAATLYWTTTISPFFTAHPFSLKKNWRGCVHHVHIICVWVVIWPIWLCELWLLKAIPAKAMQLTCSSADAKKQSWPKASGTGLIHLFRAAFGLHPNWSSLTNAKLLYLIPSVAA